MRSLTELANHYGTDKGTIGPSEKWTAHNYTDIYEAYLERYRHAPIHLLEIGLGVTGDRWRAHIVHGRNAQGGASLRMWYDYFPQARIFGLDINACPYLDNDRITTFVADQGNVDDLDSFMKAVGGIEFDAIIDDGSHRPEHQQISFSYFFKRLKVGGLYIIEDLLSNGLGDRPAGMIVSGSVKNTRSVLKRYLADGSFLEPNALIDSAYLQEHIGYMRFHLPRSKERLVIRANLRQPVHRIVSFQQDTESLCVIRKK